MGELISILQITMFNILNIDINFQFFNYFLYPKQLKIKLFLNIIFLFNF